MTDANEALKNIYSRLMEEAEFEFRTGEASSIEECCQAQLEFVGYHGVDVDALDLMQDKDPTVVCVLCTGDVAKTNGAKVIWTKTSVAMN